MNDLCSTLQRIAPTDPVRSAGAAAENFAAFALRLRLLLVLCLFLFVTGCGNESPSPKSIPKTAAGKPMTHWPTDDRRLQVFSGSESCRECHGEIYDRYSHHPMAHATRPVSELEATAFSREAEFQRGGREYVVAESTDESGTNLVHCERVSNSSGDVIYDLKANIDFGIGSGKRGFSFVTNREGLLFQSPLTWYSEGNRWDLSPGYNPASHPGFERRISDGCISCHVGRAAVAESGEHRFKTPPFLEFGIGCERCHGPGQSHIDFHTAGLNSSPDPIVNPHDLDWSARESVCYQCHLHGARRVLRADRSEYDFRPGDKISDIWIVLRNGTGIDNNGQTSAVSQVEQVIASQCFIKSEGRFGCISCHDPHSTPDVSQSVSYFRKKCLECHSTAGHECSMDELERHRENAQDSCVACHMPRLNASDVPHTSQTDHRILKRPIEPASIVSPRASGMTLFLQKDFPVPDAELQRAQGLMLAEASWNGNSRQMASSSSRLLAPMASPASTDVRVLDAQSGNLFQSGQFDAGLRMARQAEQIDPEDEAIIELQTIGLSAKGDNEAALKKTEAYLRLNRWNSQILARRVTLLVALQRRDDAMQAAIEALDWNPWLHSIRAQLIEMAVTKGDHEMVKVQTQILDQLRQMNTDNLLKKTDCLCFNFTNFADVTVFVSK